MVLVLTSKVAARSSPRCCPFLWSSRTIASNRSVRFIGVNLRFGVLRLSLCPFARGRAISFRHVQPGFFYPSTTSQSVLFDVAQRSPETFAFVFRLVWDGNRSTPLTGES